MGKLIMEDEMRIRIGDTVCQIRNENGVETRTMWKVEAVQLGNFTSTYNYRDHGYIDVGLRIENPTKSILEKGQMPYVAVLIRIFVETVSSEHQRDLWHVLRGFKIDLEEYVRKTTDNPIQYPSLGDATLSIKDNHIKLKYKFHNGGGCVNRPADRIRYQVLTKGNK